MRWMSHQSLYLLLTNARSHSLCLFQRAHTYVHSCSQAHAHSLTPLTPFARVFCVCFVKVPMRPNVRSPLPQDKVRVRGNYEVRNCLHLVLSSQMQFLWPLDLIFHHLYLNSFSIIKQKKLQSFFLKLVANVFKLFGCASHVLHMCFTCILMSVRQTREVMCM